MSRQDKADIAGDGAVVGVGGAFEGVADGGVDADGKSDPGGLGSRGARSGGDGWLPGGHDGRA